LIGAVLLLGAAPAFACVQGISSTATYVEINVGGTLARVNFAVLASGSRAQKAGQLETLLQQFLDVRLTRLSIDLLDPDKLADPKQRGLFWGDADGVARPDDPVLGTHLVSRGCEVTSVVWDGTTYAVTLEATN